MRCCARRCSAPARWPCPSRPGRPRTAHRPSTPRARTGRYCPPTRAASSSRPDSPARSSPAHGRWCPARHTSGTTPRRRRGHPERLGLGLRLQLGGRCGRRRRRIADRLRRHRRGRRGRSDPGRHQQQLRRREDALAHLAVLRGGLPRAGLRNVPAGWDGGGAARDGTVQARGRRGRPGPQGRLPDRGRVRRSLLPLRPGHLGRPVGRYAPGALRRQRHLRLVHLGDRARPGRLADPHPLPGRRRRRASTAARAATTPTTACWFTTKGDNRVWQVNLATGTYELAYDDNLVTPGTAPLTGVDNITGSTYGDLYVAEDGGNMEICLITPDDTISPVPADHRAERVGDHRPGLHPGRRPALLLLPARHLRVVVGRHHVLRHRPLPPLILPSPF